MGELLDEEARPITPKRPTSAAGKKSGEATAASTKAGVSDAATLEGETVEGELLDEETRPVTPKRPTSAAGKNKAGEAPDASSKTKTTTKKGGDTATDKEEELKEE